MEVKERKTQTEGFDKLFQKYYSKIDEKYFKIICLLDRNISKTVRESGIETRFYTSTDQEIGGGIEVRAEMTSLQLGRNKLRPVKSNGIWCCILIPSILLLNSFTQDVTLPYRLTAFLSVGLLCYSVLFVMFLSVSSLVLKNILFGGCVASLLLSTLMIYVFLECSLLYSLASSATAVYSYCILLRVALCICSRTFTIGEAMVVTQGATLSIQMAVAQIVLKDEVDEESRLIRLVVYTAITTVGLIVAALYYLRETQRNLETLGYVMAAGAFYALIVLHVVLGPTCILNILRCIFRDQHRIKLFTFWLSLLILAVLVLVVRTMMAVKATTATRKSFHVLGALVFLSGIVYDVQFMRLAAGLVFAVIVLVEALRKSKIEPISSTLQTAFDVYSDEKDSGCFAMTPIYLYVGLACPLVLVPHHPGNEVELLSGVLATGVGDTAASWFGERYGCTKWPNCNRTLEGTAFNIVAQVITIYSLQLFDLLESSAILRAVVAATVSGLVEARIEQVDNLILPLVTIISFQLTFFIS